MTMFTFPVRLFFIVFFAEMICQTGFANPRDSAAVGAAVPELREYYRFLASLSRSSPAERISRVKDYLETHPGFERTYPYLLDHLLYAGREAEAKSYFRNLSALPACSRGSQWMLAKLYTMEDRPAEALQSFREALNNGPPSIFLLNDFSNFLSQYQQQYNALEEIDRLAVIHPLKEMARALWYRNVLDYQRVIDICDQLPPEYAADDLLLNILSYCYSETGQPSQAESTLQKGFEQVKSHGDRQLEAYYLATLGARERQKGDFEESVEHLEKALSISTQFDDLMLLAMVEGTLGETLAGQRRFPEAQRRIDRAIQICAALRMDQTLAGQYLHKGKLYLEWGKFSDCLDEFARCEQIAQKTQDLSRLVAVWMEKCRFYKTLNLNALAEYEYRKTYQWAREHGYKKLEFEAFSGIASVLMADKRYGEVRRFYREALALPENFFPPGYRIYWKWMNAYTYYLEAQFDSAKAGFAEAYQAARNAPQDAYSEYVQAYARFRIGSIAAAQGDFSEALRIYSEDLIKQVAGRNTQLKMNLDLYTGKVYERQNDLEKALAHYRRAAETLEKSREELKVEQLRIGYFAGGEEVYQALIHGYFKLYRLNGKPEYLEKLFAYLEMARARTLKDLRFRDAASREKIIQTPAYAEYRLACENLQRLQRRIRQSPAQHDSLYLKYEAARFQVLFNRLRLVKEDLATARPSLPSFSQVLQGLQKLDMGLLLYHVSDSSVFALAAMDPQTIEAVEFKISRDSLAGLIDRLLEPFHKIPGKAVNNIPFHAAIAHDLYRILVKPLEEKITLKKDLLLIPDLALSGLPFEMLLAAPPAAERYFPTDSAEYAQDFLLHRYSFLYSPSAWLGSGVAAPEPSRPQILVLANPVTAETDSTAESFAQRAASRSNWRYGILWYADKEGERIREIYPATTVYRREAATPGVLKEQVSRHGILHFATHAFADTIFDAFSGLVLALGEDTTDDGLLMGFEIADMRFDCDLVTLSACETGVGQRVAGEGVLGLPRLFLGAGARRVLMTHWKVGDRFSMELMPQFYDRFLNRDQSQAHALEEAKRFMLAQAKPEEGGHYRHPFFWAAFTLYGEPALPPRQSAFPAIRWLLGTLLVILAAGLSYWIYSRRRNRTNAG